MGITIDFLAKHLRPITTKGYETYCSKDLSNYLVDNLKLTYNDVITLFNSWKTVAQSDPQKDSSIFVQAAKEVSTARWSELYSTQQNTILFLDDIHLTSLSTVSQKAGKSARFTFDTKDRPIPIAVTITQVNETTLSQYRTHIIGDVKGFNGSTDANANCVHFENLLPR